MMTSDFRREVEIRPFSACAMHLAIIIGTVRSLWTWLLGRYHVPQNQAIFKGRVSGGESNAKGQEHETPKGIEEPTDMYLESKT